MALSVLLSILIQEVYLLVVDWEGLQEGWGLAALGSNSRYKV